MAASRYIAPATLHALSKLQPWQTVIAVAFDWAAIVASVLAAECLRNPVVYVLAVLIVAGRMHGLGVLMHDFAHYRFIEGHRALSDWFCEIAISWPILASVHGYRRNHLAHHQHTNTDRDPDWTVKVGDRRFIFPREWGETATTLLSYVLIIGSARDLLELSRRFQGWRELKGRGRSAHRLLCVNRDVSVVDRWMAAAHRLLARTLFYGVLPAPLCPGHRRTRRTRP